MSVRYLHMLQVSKFYMAIYRYSIEKYRFCRYYECA